MKPKMSENFDELLMEVLSDKDARAAANENALRRSIGNTISELRSRAGLSLRDLAREMGTSLSQVQRLAHREVGGSVTLNTLCRAAEALGQVIVISMREAHLKEALPGRASTWAKATIASDNEYVQSKVQTIELRSGPWTVVETPSKVEVA